ncbi:disease resistance protein RPM1-like [Coffea eugenioides]|uniref:disease resistance protein RPM1-like n=1 Tax=Coffea eugenioides TaxID=49369 RepID=UPI000F60B739|nr:disease resistance protein RPM1-like [Coffea eugenioides]
MAETVLSLCCVNSQLFCTREGRLLRRASTRARFFGIASTGFLRLCSEKFQLPSRIEKLVIELLAKYKASKSESKTQETSYSQLLEEDDYQLKVVSVVGMGGLGKNYPSGKKSILRILSQKAFPSSCLGNVSQTCDLFRISPERLDSAVTQGRKKPVPQSIESLNTTELKRNSSKDFLSTSWKTCLLYTSIYPEDYAIECYDLINLWIAERFVEWREGMSIEDVAWGCLSELVNRRLIQVTDVFYEGLPNTCRIHDLLREVILLKSREQNMVTVITEQLTRWPSEKVRRLVVHGSSSNNTQHHQQRPNYCFDHLRSFVTVGSTNLLLHKMLLSEVSRSSKLLKVLDLTGQEAQKKIPNEIFKMFRLKHLDLYGTGVERVPKAIGKLQHLEYLNLGETGVRELPTEILKLQKLRVLRVYQQVDSSDADYGYHGFKAPSNMVRLLALEILDCIDASSGSTIVKEIGKLTQLRELYITKLRREDGKELCSSLANLTSLRELSVTSIGKGDDHEIIDLNHHHPSLSSSSSSFLQSLRMLILRGRLEKMPKWIVHLHGLVRIDLDWSGLRSEEDPFESLQHLPNLVSINFCGSYQGEGLCFKAGGFLKLEWMYLKRLEGLRWMRVEEGALPRFHELILEQLPLLDELPLGIQHLSHLQGLYLYEMSSKMIEKVENQKEESEDYRKIAHIPEIVIGCYTDDGEWRQHSLWAEKK